MNQPGYPDRLLELLLDESSVGLSDEQKRELEQMLSDYSQVDRDELLQVAALAQLSFLKHQTAAQESLPDSLKSRVMANAQLRSYSSPPPGSRPNAAPSPGPDSSGPSPWSWLGLPALGWYAATALAVLFFVNRPAPIPAPLPIAAQAEALLEDCADVLVNAWDAPSEPGYQSVTGDVVWCPSSQTGFMRLAGMPTNNPTAEQYQLWIVDPERDERPVDGGVFDVASTGNVVIPIDAKLDIISPAAFAITKEVPGGVVVSAGPLLVVAPVKT